MTTAKNGMIVNACSDEVYIVTYAERLGSWDAEQLDKMLDWCDSQLYSSHRDTFGRYCDVSAFRSGLLAELRRRELVVV